MINVGFLGNVVLVRKCCESVIEISNGRRMVRDDGGLLGTCRKYIANLRIGGC